LKKYCRQIKLPLSDSGRLIKMKKFINLLKILSGTRFLVRRLHIKFIIKQTAGREFGTVVDVGAGRAPYKKFIKCEKYVPLDIENLYNVPDMIVCDLNRAMPLQNSFCDLVIMTETLEHVKKPQFVLSEIFRILKPGGKLLMTSPFVWPVHGSPNDHFRYTNFGIEYLLKENGFQDISVKPSNGYIYTMCQLLVINCRRFLLRPFVLAINIFGYLIGSKTGSKNFPLGQQAVAKK